MIRKLGVVLTITAVSLIVALTPLIAGGPQHPGPHGGGGNEDEVLKYKDPDGSGLCMSHDGGATWHTHGPFFNPEGCHHGDYAHLAS